MARSSISLSDSNEFMNYFKGNEEAYGQYLPPKEKTKKGEKQKGTSWTETKKHLSAELYRKHLTGEQGLGLVPIDSNNNVRFCVIDIDVYPLNLKKYQDTINEYELPFLIFRSKSGGAHLYLFFKEDIKAEKIVPMVQKWVQVFGLPLNTEVFPKQRRLRTSGAGNWINLPYFGTDRKMVDSNLRELNLQEALGIINEKLITYDQLSLVYEDLPISDGPPCLQSLFIMNDPNMYEMYLFNLAIYLKTKRPNDWQDYLYRANGRLQDGLDQERIEKQIIQTHERKTYSYRCSEDPICSRCDKANCEGRKFGKGGDEISDFTFEDLIQVLSDPPHYKWIVNGSVMTFFSEQELRNQDKFADYCMRNLHKVPNRLKNQKWVAILNKAFSDVKSEAIDLKDDISPGALLAEYFYEFLFDRARAKTKSQVPQLGRVYENTDKGVLYFRKSELLKYITVTKGFRYFGPTEIQSKLKVYGAYSGTLYVSKEKNAVRTWNIPVKKAQELGDSNFDEEEIDFSDLVEDNGDNF